MKPNSSGLPAEKNAKREHRGGVFDSKTGNRPSALLSKNCSTLSQFSLSLTLQWSRINVERQRRKLCRSLRIPGSRRKGRPLSRRRMLGSSIVSTTLMCREKLTKASAPSRSSTEPSNRSGFLHGGHSSVSASLAMSPLPTAFLLWNQQR
jgi:hypothetical protein